MWITRAPSLKMPEIHPVYRVAKIKASETRGQRLDGRLARFTAARFRVTSREHRNNRLGRRAISTAHVRKVAEPFVTGGAIRCIIPFKPRSNPKRVGRCHTQPRQIFTPKSDNRHSQTSCLQTLWLNRFSPLGVRGLFGPVLPRPLCHY